MHCGIRVSSKWTCPSPKNLISPRYAVIADIPINLRISPYMIRGRHWRDSPPFSASKIFDEDTLRTYPDPNPESDSEKVVYHANRSLHAHTFQNLAIAFPLLIGAPWYWLLVLIALGLEKNAPLTQRFRRQEWLQVTSWSRTFKSHPSNDLFPKISKTFFFDCATFTILLVRSDACETAACCQTSGSCD